MTILATAIEARRPVAQPKAAIFAPESSTSLAMLNPLCPHSHPDSNFLGPQ